MLNDDCIYLTCKNYQIILDCGKFNETRTRYIHLYKDGLLKFTLELDFVCDCMFIRHDVNDIRKSVMWKCKKNNDDEYSIIINGYIYYVDKNNLKQVELFKEFAGVFVSHEY